MQNCISELKGIEEMKKQVEFYFDVSSPAAYLAWARLPAIIERHDAELVYRPILLGGVFKAIGNSSAIVLDAKRNYLLMDMIRYARHLGIPYQMNPYFPMMTLALMRGAIAAKMEGASDAFLNIVFPAIWQHGLNMNNPEVVTTVLNEGGFETEQYLRSIKNDSIKQALIAATAEAVDRGVFGAPTFFVDNEMFFGQDRLDFVDRALAA